METDVLISYLDAQRRHVLGIIEGLDEDTLRRPVLPSGWSCLGLVRHLALDVEQFWFRAVVAGEQAVVDRLAAEPGGAWRVGAGQGAEEVLESYRREAGLANEVIRARDLDAPPAWWHDEREGERPPASLRHVVLHVLAETACHAGHLDAVRELIDGRRWLVLD